MGNVIPWSKIHPSIKSEEPFIAVVVVDSHRRICVSELVEFEPAALADADTAQPTMIAAAQAAAARVAAGYRTRRKSEPQREQAWPVAVTNGGLRVLQGGRPDC